MITNSDLLCAVSIIGTVAFCIASQTARTAHARSQLALMGLTWAISTLLVLVFL